MKKSVLIFIFVFVIASINAAEYKRVIHVSPDGTGDFSTINECFEAIRAYMDYNVDVYIANGMYKEKVVVPSWIEHVTFIGENPDSTIISWSDHANIDNMGTFRTYTVRVDGDNLTFKNLTIENNAPQLGQAVALHTEGDSLRFVNCRLLGNQDTVFTGGRHTTLWFEDCYIEGTTDFIFGAATAYFDNCDIMCKRDSYITAASTPADVEIGYVFDGCRIQALPEVKNMYLGRPWRPYGYTAFINCVFEAPIHPDGWHNWKNPDNERTARYYEYGNSGHYADSSQRVDWAKTLTPMEVEKIRETKNKWNK